MIDFSENSIPELFIQFGNTIYNKEDSVAYLFLESMLKEAEKYGKIEGTFARVENLVKNYKGIIALIISVATIVLALLGRGIITVG